MTGADAVERWCTRHPLGLGPLYAAGLAPEDWERPLTEACRSRGIVIASLEGVVEAEERRLVEPWDARPITELIDHLLAHYHRPFDAKLAEVDAALAPSPASREVHVLLDELRDDMAQHMAKEEGVLFPWLRARSETAATPLRIMQLEHADTLQLVHSIHTALRTATPHLRELWQRFERWLCEHIHLENQLLVRR